MDSVGIYILLIFLRAFQTFSDMILDKHPKRFARAVLWLSVCCMRKDCTKYSKFPARHPILEKETFEKLHRNEVIETRRTNFADFCR